MGYDKKHTQILSAQEGYNILQTHYKTYRKHLDSFENGYFTRFLPRGNNIDIVDIGAGDGRLFRFLHKLDYNKYVAFDIAQKLLQNHPKGVEKVIGDAEKELPFPDESFALATAFFLLEHIANIQKLFDEVYRILKPGGTWIVGHFMQRRAYIHSYQNTRFKIQQYTYSLEEVKKLANQSFFTTHVHDVYEDKTCIGYIISLEK